MRGRRRLSRAFWFPSPAHRRAFAGTYVALVCPNNDTTAPCQLNAHVIAMVAPESILHGLRVGASFEIDGSGTWEPLAIEDEYMNWNGSSPRVSTGRVSKQYKAWLQTSTFARLDCQHEVLASSWPVVAAVLDATKAAFDAT